jgi:hypothetical protein
MVTFVGATVIELKLVALEGGVPAQLDIRNSAQSEIKTEAHLRLKYCWPDIYKASNGCKLPGALYCTRRLHFESSHRSFSGNQCYGLVHGRTVQLHNYSNPSLSKESVQAECVERETLLAQQATYLNL